MYDKGLLVNPEFNNIEKYLESGKRTQVTNKIKEILKDIRGKDDEEIIKKILIKMHDKTESYKTEEDAEAQKNKFKRTAEEILESGKRTGCCDSSTLFVTMVRAMGIPAMQVITLWKPEKDKEYKTGKGHYFSACYIDIGGKKDWVLIDSARKVEKIEDVTLYELNKDERNMHIDGKYGEYPYYAFAYVRDYSDIALNRKKNRRCKKYESNSR